MSIAGRIFHVKYTMLTPVRTPRDVHLILQWYLNCSVV